MSTFQFQFLILILAGWVNRSQQDVIEADVVLKVLGTGGAKDR